MNNNMDPRLARAIGYAAMFGGFIVVGIGTACFNILEGVVSLILYGIAGLFLAFSIIWMIRKVRCPHCGQLLHLKLYDISVCPYCGKSTDPNNRY